MMQLLKLLQVGLLALFVGGCAGYKWVPPQPNDPDYAPAIAKAPAMIPNLSGAIYQSDFVQESLFTDLRAYQVGDILTVRLAEATAAAKAAKSSANKATSVDVTSPEFFGSMPLSGSAKLNSTNAFSGDGASNQNNSLHGNISVTVAEVLPNGNLAIRGEKWLTLNQGSEFIRLSGIVRPYDVDANNIIDSNKIANPRITYSGTGMLAEANQEGWLARLFNAPIFPY